MLRVVLGCVDCCCRWRYLRGADRQILPAMFDQLQSSSFPSDTSGKFGSAGDSTSSPVPSSVAQQTQQQQQPTPFNALASTFAAAAPQQHPTLPPGYAYFYGGVGNMGAQLVRHRINYLR